MELEHRVVTAPLYTLAVRAAWEYPGDFMPEYYSQRASEGAFIVSEGISISIAVGVVRCPQRIGGA